MKGIIYKATDNWTGKVYIGQTINGLEVRKAQHLRDAEKDCDKTLFHLALFQHGGDFTWEVVEEFEGSRDELFHILNVAEEYHIIKFRATDERYGLNSTAGGYCHDVYAAHCQRKKGKRNTPREKYLQYDLNGNFVKEWGALYEIAQSFGQLSVSRTTLLSNGEWRGFQWRRKVKGYAPPTIKPYEGHVKIWKVLQYSLAGEYIATWDTITSAVNMTGDSHSTIRALCDGKVLTQLPKYQWRRYEDNFPNKIDEIVIRRKRENYVSDRPDRRILQYSLEGEYIQTFSGITEASYISKDSVPVIKRHCLGEKTRTSHYQWRYYTENFEKNIGKVVYIEKKPRKPRNPPKKRIFLPELFNNI